MTSVRTEVTSFRCSMGAGRRLRPRFVEAAEEVVNAARGEADGALAHEVADLIFHVWVMMALRGVEPSSVYSVLRDRFGVGGLEEKASRPNSGSSDVSSEEDSP